MTIKVILYILFTPLVIWAFESININKIFKKNRVYQATIVYVIFVLIATYLLVNFCYDFYQYVRFV